MKKVLAAILCICAVLSFSACSSNSNYLPDSGNTKKETQKNVTVTDGSYVKTDMYIASTGQHVSVDLTATEYVYLENDSLYWYTLNGVLWTCKNYDYAIDGNKLCCTPKYNKGLVEITFTYDENTNEITYEANDVITVFSYYSQSKPTDDVYQDF